MAISYLRNYRYLCCMNNITLQSNTQMMQIRGMYGWNIAHDAMLKQGKCQLSEALCAYCELSKRLVCRV